MELMELYLPVSFFFFVFFIIIFSLLFPYYYLHSYNFFILFLDGQTSSGKTFTMLGNDKVNGILQLASLDLFKLMAEKTDRDFIVRVSFVEIYNEVLNNFFVFILLPFSFSFSIFI